MLAPAQPLSIPLGDDACAQISEDKTVPISTEYYNSPNRIEMVSILCTYTCVINSYEVQGSSAVLTKSMSISNSQSHYKTLYPTLLQCIVFWVIAHT